MIGSRYPIYCPHSIPVLKLIFFEYAQASSREDPRKLHEFVRVALDSAKIQHPGNDHLNRLDEYLNAELFRFYKY